MQEEQKNIVETAIAAGRELAISMKYENGTPILLAPKDFAVHQFPELRAFPIRIEQTVTHTTAQSFIEYYNQFAGQDSVIFINDQTNEFTAIIDYHSADTADWKAHKAIFTLKSTTEWDAWRQNNKKPMTQAEFGQFIENQLSEIITPAGADMLEIALSLQAKTEIKFSSAQRLDNGQMQLAYNEIIDGSAGTKGQFKVPEKFTIGLKLFKGAEPYQMDARLRYRIKDGNLTMWYELIRPHAVIDANLDETTRLIESSILEGKVYRGIV